MLGIERQLNKQQQRRKVIDKTIGVIPPRNELSSFSEKVTVDFKDKKSDFESYLDRLKDRDDQALGGSKKRAQDEPRSETEKPKKREEAEESKEGEKKKARNKLEDEMVLMSMASIESVIKTPDAEENLDGLEKTSFVPTLTASTIEQTVDSEILSHNLETEQPIVLEPELIQDMPEASDMQTVKLAVAPQSFELETEAATIQAMPEGLPADSNKVLETLNREQLFQKLEAMAQPEAPAAEELVVDENFMDKSMQVKAETAVSAEISQKLATAVEADSSQSESSLDQDDQTSFSDKESASTVTSSQQPQPGLKEFSLRPAEAAIAPQNSTQNSETQDTNVNEILKQAQYLVKQGGGEVSVRMSPEGMGEVHLKVMLDNGKMNLELNAQDKNIQKLIQDNLSDLKSSLAAHQISVEHVTLNSKVATVESMHKANDSQNFSDSRQFADSGANSFANQSHQNRQQNQEASQRFNHEMSQAVPIAQSEIRKAVAHRVYQANKAQTLNAVA